MRLDDPPRWDPELALRHIPEYVIVLSDRDKILFFTDEAQRIHNQLGTSLELGASFQDTAVVPARKNLYADIIKQIKETKTQIVTEAVVNDIKNPTIFFEVSYIPVLNVDGEVTQITIIAREITPQKIYEKKTNQLVHELSVLIEDANAIVFGVDSLGYVTDWNKECVRLTQFEKGDVFTKTMSSLIDESSLAPFEKLVTRSLQGELTNNHELHIKTREGMFTALVSATPKRNSLGHVVGSLFVGQDISELVNYRKSLEEKVQERTASLKKALEKEKELVNIKNRFVSIASHEFKMPLAAIGYSTNSIKANRNLVTSDLELVNVIERQVSIMRSILDDVLTLDKKDSNSVKAKLERVDIAFFLANLSDEIELATNRTHRIIKHFPAVKTFINADEKLLRNVFSNILSNAIKFSPEKEKIYLHIAQDHSQVLITVQDEGIGIQKEDLNRVFEPFNRGSNANKIKGTGLGLSIVKKATEALGGKLELESEIGKGTTIRIIFNAVNDTI